MTCAKDGCYKRSHARGLCKNHYERQRERAARQLRPVVRSCRDCAADFSPRGPQQRCEACRTKVCPTCKSSFLTSTRRQTHCSRQCVGRDPQNVARLSDPTFPRGVKPRTYAQRERTKHGSAEQREWRSAVFARDDYTCQICGASGVRLQADHIEPFGTHPDLRYELSNGRTLCVPCHRDTPTYGWRGYWLKVRGEIAAHRLDQGVLDFGSTA